jgi:hypothetical protein
MVRWPKATARSGQRVSGLSRPAQPGAGGREHPMEAKGGEQLLIEVGKRGAVRVVVES